MKPRAWHGLGAGLAFALADWLAAGVTRTPAKMALLIGGSALLAAACVAALAALLRRPAWAAPAVLAGALGLQMFALQSRLFSLGEPGAWLLALGIALAAVALAALLHGRETFRAWLGAALAVVLASLLVSALPVSPLWFGLCVMLPVLLGAVLRWLPRGPTLGVTVALAAVVSGWVPLGERRPARALPPAAVPAAPPQAPNVVLVLLDTLRADHVERQAGGITPTLARLAAAGTDFEQAVSQAPWTLPSHATLFTSRLPNDHGCVRKYSKLPAEADTLAESFRAAGYATAAFTGGGFVHPDTGLDQGFEVFDPEAELYFPYFQVHVPLIWRVVMNRYRPLTFVLDWIHERGGMRALRDKVTRWAGRRDPARPFFLFVHTYEIHDYHIYHPGSDAGVQALRERLSPRFRGRLWISPAEIEEHASAADVAIFAAIYRHRLGVVDRELGLLLDDLKDTGRPQLVCVTSDHGEGFSHELGRLFHQGRLHDDLLRVPLLLSGPGVPAGRRVSEQVRLLDLMPTLLVAAGLPVPPSAQGLPLQACLEGEQPFPEESWAECGFARQRVIARREPGWKAMTGPTGAECYALGDDPEERHNRAGEPELAVRVEQVEAWRRKHPVAVSESAVFDPETAEQLRLLGYIE